MDNLEKKKIIDSLLITIAFLLVCWGIFLVDQDSAGELKKWGLKPREWSGLVGIISMHFLHSDFEHILNNTWAFLVLSGYLFYFYRSIAFRVFPRMLLLAGLLLWLGGRDGNHIGASLAIYAMASFLFFSGIFRGSIPLMAVSSLVVFSYGSMFWGIFPIKPEMSWEGHLSGGISGLIMAFAYRLRGPQRRRYQWELDEEREKDAEAANGSEDLTESAPLPNLSRGPYSRPQASYGIRVVYDFIPEENKNPASGKESGESMNSEKF